MRWLLIAFLVSLGGLLFAAAGVTFHILRQRVELRRKSMANTRPITDSANATNKEPDV